MSKMLYENEAPSFQKIRLEITVDGHYHYQWQRHPLAHKVGSANTFRLCENENLLSLEWFVFEAKYILKSTQLLTHR